MARRMGAARFKSAKVISAGAASAEATNVAIGNGDGRGTGKAAVASEAANASAFTEEFSGVSLVIA